MPEATVETQPATESLGWRAGLPGDLQQSEVFKPFKTVGEFAKSYLETTSKYSELEGKIKDYVPKLPDNASDEDRNLYYDALGRPKTASEYEFEGEDKNAPEWTNFWKSEFHAMGLTKAQVKNVSAKFNGQMQKMVDAHNAQYRNDMAAAEQKLKSEMGDKFETNVELAKRMTEKHLGAEFDKTFQNLTGEGRFGVVKLLLKVAELTGEDRSPQAGHSQTGAKPSFITYDKSPAPPKK